MVKHKLTLSIDKEIITQAKKQQINLSSFLEIRLIDYLNYKEKCSRRDSNPCSWFERPKGESSMSLAQPVLDTYLLKRKLGGISDDWLAHIEYVLENYLESIDWQVDESKTLHYFGQLKDNYSTCSYRKRAYQIRKFLQANNIIWADQIQIPPEPVGLPKRITLDDIHKTLNYFKGNIYDLQLKAVTLLGATSGMRAEEIYQLDYGDFDFDKSIVRIDHDPDNGKTTKTSSGRIAISNSEAKQVLVDYFDHFESYDLLQAPFGKFHIQRQFRDAPIRVKDLRKFFSQEWDRKGGPTSIKKLLMGHSGDVDLCHYNAQNEDDLKLIYDKVGIKIGG